MRAYPELQARIEELASKSTERRLTDVERAESEGCLRANRFVAILQRHARQLAGLQFQHIQRGNSFSQNCTIFSCSLLAVSPNDRISDKPIPNCLAICLGCYGFGKTLRKG